MKLPFLVAVTTLAWSGFAGAQVFQARDLDLVWKRYDKDSRHPMLQLSGLDGREVDQEVSLFWNIDLFNRWLYFDNQILGLTDRPQVDPGPVGQFRVVGWNAFLGVRMFDNVWFEREHTSLHILDHQSPQRFPAVDSWNIKVKFLGGK